MYSSEVYPLKRWDRITTWLYWLVIKAFTAATLIETTAVTELLLIKRTDPLKRLSMFKIAVIIRILKCYRSTYKLKNKIGFILFI